MLPIYYAMLGEKEEEDGFLRSISKNKAQKLFWTCTEPACQFEIFHEPEMLDGKQVTVAAFNSTEYEITVSCNQARYALWDWKRHLYSTFL